MEQSDMLARNFIDLLTGTQGVRQLQRTRTKLRSDEKQPMLYTPFLFGLPVWPCFFQVIIGKINGHCTGGGVGLAAACDLSVIRDDVQVGNVTRKGRGVATR